MDDRVFGDRAVPIPDSKNIAQSPAWKYKKNTPTLDASMP
jgi:hypothetical protein